MKVHAAVATALREHGVDLIFGLMGDVNMLLLSSFIEECGGTFVPAVHEAGAVSMADGYHRLSGRLGVVSVTHGPAFTNTLTALVEGVRAGSPLLILTGAPPAIRGHLQYVDHESLAATAGAAYERVWRPDSAVIDVACAVRRALVERRPVVLDLPSDLLLTDVDYRRTQPVSVPELGPPSEESVDTALGVILSSSRPVIIAGRGAARKDARDSIIDFARVLGAPLATTLLAKDLFAGLPENIGVCGSLSTPPALDAISRSDCVIAFGASLSRHTAAAGELFTDKAVIQCSGFDSPTGQFVSPTLYVAGDAAQTAREFACKARELGSLPRTSALTRLREENSRWQAARNQWPDRSGSATVDVAKALRRLSELLPRNRVVVTDAGRFTLTAWHEVEVTQPGAFTHSASFGSIGLGLATAIGAAVARPAELTVCLIGDGGFMMSAVNLWTAVRQGSNLLVVVIDDGSYGAEYDKLSSYGVSPDHSLMTWDVASVARGYGVDALSVRGEADLSEVISRVSDLTGPLLLDVHVDPAHTANYDGTPQ